MKPHEQRVVDEKADLDERLRKLVSFCYTDTCLALPSDEQQRLSRQAGLMQKLSDVLGERIAAFPKETQN